MQRFVNSVVVPQLDGPADQKPKFQPGEAPHVKSQKQGNAKRIKQEHQESKLKNDAPNKFSKGNAKRTTFDDDSTITTASSVVQVEDSQIDDQRAPFAAQSQDDLDEGSLNLNEETVDGMYSHHVNGYLTNYYQEIANNYSRANGMDQQSLAFDQGTDGYPGTTDGVPSLPQIDSPEPSRQAPPQVQRPTTRPGRAPLGYASAPRGMAHHDLDGQRPPTRTGINPNEGNKRAPVGQVMNNSGPNDQSREPFQGNIYHRQMLEQAKLQANLHSAPHNAIAVSERQAAMPQKNKIASLHHPTGSQPPVTLRNPTSSRLQQNMLENVRVSEPENSANVPQPLQTASVSNVNAALVLDYDPKKLGKMSYAELRKQNFDDDPTIPSQDDSEGEAIDMSTAERVEYLLNQDEEVQFMQFRRLSLAEWEQAGNAIIGEIGKVMQNLFTVRGGKRTAAQGFEEKVYQRHVVVEKRKRLTDDAMDRMKAGGVELITQTPKKAKTGK